MMNSEILNRAQFWIQINFSETLQDIQSVGLDKLIATITVEYTKTVISKLTSFVGIIASWEF